MESHRRNISSASPINQMSWKTYGGSMTRSVFDSIAVEYAATKHRRVMQPRLASAKANPSHAPVSSKHGPFAAVP